MSPTSSSEARLPCPALLMLLLTTVRSLFIWGQISLRDQFFPPPLCCLFKWTEWTAQCFYLSYGSDEKTRRSWLLMWDNIANIALILFLLTVPCTSSEDKIPSPYLLPPPYVSPLPLKWGQDIQFCPSPPPYVNPLPLWLRTRYLVLLFPQPNVNP